MLTRLRYLLRETGLGLRRGGWMNWAAISTITVLLFLLGLGLQSTWQLDRLVNQFGNQLEVSVFLRPGVEAQSLQGQVAQLPQVARVQPVTKEQAWAQLSQDLGLQDVNAATAQLNGNPLVDELRVRARRPEAVLPLVKQLRSLRGVDEVQYLPEVLQRLQQLNQGLNGLGFGIIALLTFTALSVSTTTIRLIVLARRREIEIMKLVGATALWVSLPFLLQGLIFGLTGGLFAWLGMVTAQRFVMELLSQQPDFVQFLVKGIELEPSERALIPVLLLSFGGLVGLFGSLLAVGRFAFR